MPLILSIETATGVCAVALARDGNLLSVKEESKGYAHSENITMFIEAVCKSAGIALQELDAIAVSKGPGSYTGLRIGVSTAKGLCYALGKPLIAIDTLKSLANTFLISNDQEPPSVLVPMLDARRMEVYCSVFDASLNELSPPAAVIVNENSFSGLFRQGPVAFFGDGAAKCEAVIGGNPNAIFSTVRQSAAGMIALAEEKFAKHEFEDVSLFEPFYLKEAMIGKPAG